MTPERWYAYGNYIDEVLIMSTSAIASDAKFYIQDHLYSPAALTDASGNVIERYEYDAYGQPYIMDASYNARSSSSYGNPYLFTGRNVDFLDNGSLILQYNRFRYYDYYTGRWFSYDPIGYWDSLNLFEYAGSNPIIRTDPFGDKWKISRGGNHTAEAEVVDSSDTISQLAERIRLDKNEFRKWLTLDGMIRTSSGVKTLNQLKVAHQICMGQKVKIPNFVIAYWGGELGGFGKHFVDWGSDVSTLKRRGFFVHEIENYTAAHLEFVIDSFMKTKKLFGIFAWGHGSKRGYLLTMAGKKADDTYYSYYAKWNPEYRMGLGILFACHSQSARDYFSSNAIFWGKTGTLVPLPFHMFGPKISELIPPGF